MKGGRVIGPPSLWRIIRLLWKDFKESIRAMPAYYAERLEDWVTEQQKLDYLTYQEKADMALAKWWDAMNGDAKQTHYKCSRITAWEDVSTNRYHFEARCSVEQITFKCIITQELLVIHGLMHPLQKAFSGIIEICPEIALTIELFAQGSEFHAAYKPDGHMTITGINFPDEIKKAQAFEQYSLNGSPTTVNDGKIGPLPDYNDLPAIHQKVKYPCKCEGIAPNELWQVIIHLNDNHMWPRGDVADWLERLDIDIRFKTGEEDESRD